MAQIRRAFSDLMISAAALSTLVLMLAVLDERVREQVSIRLTPGGASLQVAEASATVRNLTAVVLEAVGDQSIEHAPLVIFALAATVLLLFMLRT